MQRADAEDEKSDCERHKLRAAADPPKWGPRDVFPLSPFLKTKRQRRRVVKSPTHNIPLEITFYLVSGLNDGISYYLTVGTELLRCRAAETQGTRPSHRKCVSLLSILFWIFTLWS